MGTTADGFASGWRVRAAGAWLLPILGLAALLTAYLPVFSAGFVWDDDLHLLDNVVLRENGLYRVWVLREAPVFWPVAFTSYWIEHRLFGLWAGGYHAVNVALHGAMRCCSRGC